MLQFIRHRINTAEELKTVAPEMGVEIDLRSNLTKDQSLHLSHDPWLEGEQFSDWLKQFQKLKIQGPLLLNTKEDGLEETIMEEMRKIKKDNFLFLDTALPTLIHWVKQGLGHKFFLRLSSFEPASHLQAFKGKVEWLWVDCFDGIPMDKKNILDLKYDFKICLVSPELQKKSMEEIKKFHALLPLADAICTKSPEYWESSFKI